MAAPRLPSAPSAKSFTLRTVRSPVRGLSRQARIDPATARPDRRSSRRRGRATAAARPAGGTSRSTSGPADASCTPVSPAARQRVQRAQDRRLHVVPCRRGNGAADHLHGGVHQHARGSAVGTVEDAPAGRIGRAGGNAGSLQRAAVAPDGVEVGPHHCHRMPRHGRIEHLGVGEGLPGQRFWSQPPPRIHWPSGSARA